MQIPCRSESARDWGNSVSDGEADDVIASRLTPTGGCVFSPAGGDARIETKQIEHATEAVVDHLRQVLRAGIEGGHRRGDDPAHLGDGGHVAQVRQGQRGFPGHQHQGPALLEGDVGGAADQARRGAAGNFPEGAHRTGRDHHAQATERTAGDARRHVIAAVVVAGQGGDLGQFVVGLVGHGQQCRAADHQVAFDAQFGEQLQQAHPIDKARGAADAHHQALRGHDRSPARRSRALACTSSLNCARMPSKLEPRVASRPMREVVPLTEDEGSSGLPGKPSMTNRS